MIVCSKKKRSDLTNHQVHPHERAFFSENSPWASPGWISSKSSHNDERSFPTFFHFQFLQASFFCLYTFAHQDSASANQNRRKLCWQPPHKKSTKHLIFQIRGMAPLCSQSEYTVLDQTWCCNFIRCPKLLCCRNAADWQKRDYNRGIRVGRQGKRQTREQRQNLHEGDLPETKLR